MVKFTPSAFVLTANETWKRRETFLQFIEQNKHLALPFHVTGLQSIIPPAYPGENHIVLARSHHGKSTVMKDVIFKAQMLIEGNPKYVVGLVSHEDVAERTAGQQARRYANPLEYQDDQFIHIGRSFGMKQDQIAELHMTNIITALEYGLKKFGDGLSYSIIVNDYLQIQPPDPFRREMTSQEQRRLQIADDMKRWCNVGVQFKCPVFNASQALTKVQRGNYTEKMRIPGAADTEEAKEIYNYADAVYAYWQPKHDHPMGTKIEEGNWNFTVTSNLMFLRIIKRKYAEEMGYSEIVGRVFPLLIEPNGDVTYSQSFHEEIYHGHASS